MASQRVLTLTFEFHVPEGLRSNIRGKRLTTAITALSAGVQALAPTHFPWADRMVVKSEWAYRWIEKAEPVSLPVTARNTVTPSGVEPVDGEDAADGEFVEPQP